MTPQTFSHCTSPMLSRRAFLQSMLVWAGAMWAASGINVLAAETVSGYFCALDLQTGRWLGDAPARAPHGEPGSLMKLVAAAALMEDGLLDPDERFSCAGSIERHGRRFLCQKAHGSLGLVGALGHSCNVFFVQAADRLSPQRFLTMAAHFGLDRPTGHAAAGRFPLQPDAPHSQLLVLGLDERMQPTALQLLRMAGWIATAGQPLTGLSGKPPSLSPATWQLLESGMRLAVRQGTARKLDADNRWQAAAKTGTTPYGLGYRSWLIGFYPAHQPRLVFCQRAAQGTATDQAVPMARAALLKLERS